MALESGGPMGLICIYTYVICVWHYEVGLALAGPSLLPAICYGLANTPRSFHLCQMPWYVTIRRHDGVRSVCEWQCELPLPRGTMDKKVKPAM